MDDPKLNNSEVRSVLQLHKDVCMGGDSWGGGDEKPLPSGISFPLFFEFWREKSDDCPLPHNLLEIGLFPLLVGSVGFGEHIFA